MQRFFFKMKKYEKLQCYGISNEDYETKHETKIQAHIFFNNITYNILYMNMYNYHVKHKKCSSTGHINISKLNLN